MESIIRVALSEFNDWLSYRDESIDWINARFPLVSNFTSGGSIGVWDKLLLLNRISDDLVIV